jgi:hypothetical protein
LDTKKYPPPKTTKPIQNARADPVARKAATIPANISTSAPVTNAAAQNPLADINPKMLTATNAMNANSVLMEKLMAMP